jgi:hypothetical protein
VLGGGATYIVPMQFVGGSGQHNQLRIRDNMSNTGKAALAIKLTKPQLRELRYAANHGPVMWSTVVLGRMGQVYERLANLGLLTHPVGSYAVTEEGSKFLNGLKVSNDLTRNK